MIVLACYFRGISRRRGREKCPILNRQKRILWRRTMFVAVALVEYFTLPVLPHRYVDSKSGILGIYYSLVGALSKLVRVNV